MIQHNPPPEDDSIRFDLFDVKVQNLTSDGSMKMSGKAGEYDKDRLIEVMRGTGQPGYALRIEAEWVKIADEGF